MDMKDLRIDAHTLLDMVSEPYGDLTQNEVRYAALDRSPHKIVAEGTFFYNPKFRS